MMLVGGASFVLEETSFCPQGPVSLRLDIKPAG